VELQPITFQKTDELREELQGYDQDTHLIDGLTAAASLRRVINVTKVHDRPKVISGGRTGMLPIEAQRSVQGLLF
jgi:hypothetical protein